MDAAGGVGGDFGQLPPDGGRIARSDDGMAESRAVRLQRPQLPDPLPPRPGLSPTPLLRMTRSVTQDPVGAFRTHACNDPEVAHHGGAVLIPMVMVAVHRTVVGDEFVDRLVVGPSSDVTEVD